MQSDLASKTKRPSNQPRLFLTPSEMLSPFYVLHNITGTNAVIQFKSILRPQTCKHKCLQRPFTWYLNSTPFPCPAKNGMASWPGLAQWSKASLWAAFSVLQHPPDAPVRVPGVPQLSPFHYSPYPNQRQTIDALLLILPSKYILNRLVIRQTPFHQPNDIKYKNKLSRILALVPDGSIITSET